MKVVKAWEEQGVTVPDPYRRTIKVLLAPDKEGVDELTLSHAILHPGGQTDYHSHDRPELICVLAGRGIAVCEGAEMPVEPDVVLWVARGEKHQMRNTGAETLKLLTVFIPAYTAEENYRRCLEAAR